MVGQDKNLALTSLMSLFKKTKSLPPLRMDMHAHWLPGLDDGARSQEEAVELIRGLHAMGYQHLIATPHIVWDYYRNTPQGIRTRLAEIQREIETAGIPVILEAAAEYYLDEHFYHSLLPSEESLLTLPGKHVLIETNRLQAPYFFHDAVFKLTTRGYQPLLAHPERYQYLPLSKMGELRDRGLRFQVNLLSLGGAYGPEVFRKAEQIIQHGWVDWLGTDCHHVEQLPFLEKAVETRAYARALSQSLQNFAYV